MCELFLLCLRFVAIIVLHLSSLFTDQIIHGLEQIWCYEPQKANSPFESLAPSRSRQTDTIIIINTTVIIIRRSVVFAFSTLLYPSNVFAAAKWQQRLAQRTYLNT